MNKRVLVASSPIIPPWVTEEKRTLWESRTHFVLVASDGDAQWSNILDLLGPGDEMLLEEMATIGHYWYKVWFIVDQVLRKGSAVHFLDNGLRLSKPEGDVYSALKMVGEFEALHQVSVSQSRKMGIAKAAMEGKGNWYNLSEEQRTEILRDREVMNVTELCKKHGFSRQTYYKWLETGVL